MEPCYNKRPGITNNIVGPGESYVITEVKLNAEQMVNVGTHGPLCLLSGEKEREFLRSLSAMEDTFLKMQVTKRQSK